MKPQQVTDALPLYNELFEVSKQIKLLEAFQGTIKQKSTLTLSLHSKPGEDVSINEISPDFAHSVVQTLLNFKATQKRNLLKQLDSI